MTLRYPRSLVAALALLTGLTACTTHQRHTLLTVFFEGVPPPEVERPSKPASPSQPVELIKPALPEFPTNAVQLLPHAPFREHKCSACHAPGRSQSVQGSQRAICYPCHTNVVSGAAVQHFPARKWDCLTCHKPHLSTVGKLLTAPVVALCYDCHDPLNTKPYVHEPVRRGLCVSCHTPHQSAYPNLLKQTGDPLCLSCHKAAAMQAVKGHSAIGDKKCLQCHAAHEAEKKGLLK